MGRREDLSRPVDQYGSCGERQLSAFKELRSVRLERKEGNGEGDQGL